MLVCNRRAMLASSLSWAVGDTTMMLLMGGCLVPPPPTAWVAAAAAAASTTASGTSTATTVTSAIDLDLLFTVPTPTEWLPNVISMNDPNMIWKDVNTCCRRSSLSTVSRDTKTCTTEDSTESDPSCKNPDAATTTLSSSDTFEPRTLGRIPQFNTQQTLQVLEVSRNAWNNGSGVWTQMTLLERCQALHKFLQKLTERRGEMVQTLMWEIGKNRNDAEAEFDRTIDFAKQVLELVQHNPEYTGQWQNVGATSVFVKRNAIGVYLSLAPYNYPLNECYAAIIPCLLMGNVVILKLPTIGGLVHLWTMEALRETLPPGTVSFVAGGGRSTTPPLMETGYIDGLAFIGGSNAADDLIQRHPHPHRLKVFLQLEANNLAIYMPEVFADIKSRLFDTALQQAVIGSLSYNGQRCTALKLHYVPQQHAQTFVSELVRRIEALNVGLADDQYPNGLPSQITPLPSQGRISYMQELIQDALDKGATIVNHRGGTVIGGPDSTLMIPAILYPVTPNMRVFHEEQFGPIVPVAVYQNLDGVLEYTQNENPFGQQVSIFGDDTSSKIIASMVDRFSAVFGRINLNAQCGRSPDTVPFSGRRSSAMGVMSVSDALREFSTPTVVAYSNNNSVNDPLVKDIQQQSRFLQTVP